jgi:formylglycine-generating enzyme required for sulfatase activity
VLAEWGRDNGISAICLVIDDVKGSDHMFYAQFIDTKDSKMSGKGSYVRTGVGSGDASRVALALAKQLSGPEHSRSVPAPTRSYPAELDIEMVFVEGGTFEMGCTAEQGSECGNSEKPAHTVTVGNFYIGKYEVTQAQWKAVMGSNPSANKSDDQRPVEQVAYNDVTGIDGFLAQLNAQTGKNYRLPTEAEWEYAARGGKHKSPYKYSGSDNPNEIAWHVNNSGGQSHVVGGKKPNALGIYDMSGNVWEFCSDCFGTYSASAQTNPTGPSCNESSSHMIRGGYWSGGESLVRVSWRFYVPPTAAYNDGGFRIALPYQ